MTGPGLSVLCGRQEWLPPLCGPRSHVAPLSGSLDFGENVERLHGHSGRSEGPRTLGTHCPSKCLSAADHPEPLGLGVPSRNSHPQAHAFVTAHILWAGEAPWT